MTPHLRPPMTLVSSLSPLLAAGAYILLCGLLREPARRRLGAVMIAGAGAAYLSGGLGLYEFVFCALMTFVAYRGLEDYRFVGAGWMLHAGWDVLHHLYGDPIIPFAPLSSAGCAICDLALAVWCFCAAPSPFPWANRADRRRRLESL